MNTALDVEEPVSTLNPDVAPPPVQEKNSSLNGVRYLRPEEDSLWERLVDESPQGSPFTRLWWLRAAGGTVKLLGYFKDGRLLAGMPLYFEKRFGVTLCTMPKLTQTLGPVMAAPDPRRVNANWNEMEVLTEFAEALTPQRYFFQAFHPSIQNWCPFFWRGFRQTSRLTYYVPLDDMEQIWAGITKSFRQAIRRAERAGVKVTPCDADTVWQAERKSFARQNLKVPHSIEHLRRVVKAAQDNQSGECLAAVDGSGQVHAASFMIWDRRRSYAIALGGDPQVRSRGSTPLLEWNMLQRAQARSLIYDFTGSMLQPVELFIRSFGGIQLSYNYVIKLPLWLRLLLACRGKL
jgi:hypothetical protein